MSNPPPPSSSDSLSESLSHSLSSSSSSSSSSDFFHEHVKLNETDYMIISIVAMALGIVICLFGKKVFKLFLFLAAFGATAGFTYFMELTIMRNQSVHLGRWETILIPCVAGLIGGLIVLGLVKVGLFLAGATGGAMISFVIFALVGNHFGSEAFIVRLVILGVLSLIGGILVVMLEKKIIIGVSAMGGAYAVFAGADHWVKSGFVAAMGGVFHSDQLPKGNTKLYIMAGGTVLLAIFGVIFQTIHHNRSKREGHWESDDEEKPILQNKKRVRVNY